METQVRQEQEWLSCAETAKIVRKALKEAFPGQKFSVRSRTYAGGASIDVRYADGPPQREVEAVVQQFASGRFDGMIDLAYHAEHWLLPDGTAVVRREYGHSYAEAQVDNTEFVPPEGSKLVNFGAHYIFVERDFGIGVREKLVGEVNKRIAFSEGWKGDQERESYIWRAMTSVTVKPDGSFELPEDVNEWGRR